ncbi:MAG: type IV secretion system protein [Alphaproteobacteria bacterium]|nr:type IV secretion system protein [Alphaproteobacteria bacterium]
MGLGKKPPVDLAQLSRPSKNSLLSASGAEAHSSRVRQQQMPMQSRGNVATLAERRFLWTARIFAVIAAVSVCGNILLILTLFQLVPLVRVEPFLLSFQNKSEQVVTIEPIIKDMASTKKVTETLIRQYILLRNTMVGDVEEMNRRWGVSGQVRWMSGDAVYAAFIKTSQRAIQKIQQDGFTREINIRTVIRHGSSSRWQVEFDTRDMLPQLEEPSVHRWVATLRIGYKEQRVIFANRLKNPLGFQILEYDVSAKTVE